jgi:hypothetical protein
MEDRKILSKADIRPTPKKIVFTVWYILAIILFLIGTFGFSEIRQNDSFKFTGITFFAWSIYSKWDFYKDSTLGLYSDKKSFKAGDVYSKFYGGTLFLSLLVTAVVFLLPIILRKIRNHIARNCSLSLDENGISGNRKKLFSNAQLNLPIDKVDNISISESIFDKLRGGKTVAIRSASGVIKFPWVQNADEFVNCTLARIEEFKNSVRAENQRLVSAVAQNTQTNSADRSSAEKIKELKSLLDDGLISQDEFDSKRRELIEKM